MNPYQTFVSEYSRLSREGKSYPLGGFPPAPRPERPADAAIVLLFSPHPDDECVIGALPLRLLRELKMNVINVAVTHGSRKDRQAARFQELQAACHFIGYVLVQTRPNGLEKINAQAREQDPANWRAAVQIISKII